MKILAVSDSVLPGLYHPQITERFADADVVISCGDLPNYYLEYILSMLDIPLYYVNGNHVNRVESGAEGDRAGIWGGENLHRRVKKDASGLLLAGVEGCLDYNHGPHQFSESEMWFNVFQLVPALFFNKIRYGRYLDVFVTHAAPWQTHDMEDRPHRGSKAFQWLNRVYKPSYHLHGHVHIYRSDTVTETLVGQTRVVNVFGYKQIILESIKTSPRTRKRFTEQDDKGNLTRTI
jgi:uncharacterized protein